VAVLFDKEGCPAQKPYLRKQSMEWNLDLGHLSSSPFPQKVRGHILVILDINYVLWHLNSPLVWGWKILSAISCEHLGYSQCFIIT
jgi:hypothetical protein